MRPDLVVETSVRLALVAQPDAVGDLVSEELFWQEFARKFRNWLDLSLDPPMGC
jgi:hypothetical protein